MLYAEPCPCLFTIGDAPHRAPAVDSGFSNSFRLCYLGGILTCRIGPTFETKLIARPNFVAIDASTPCRRPFGQRRSTRCLDLFIKEWPTAGAAVYDALAMQFGNRAFAAAIRA